MPEEPAKENLRPSAPDLRESVVKRPHGGARPGSGAPKGNLNALKHGRRSAQFAAAGALLASNTLFRDTLLDIARRHESKQENAAKIASDWLVTLMTHARTIAEGKPSRGPFADLLQDETRLNAQSTTHERRSTKKNAARSTHRQHGQTLKIENHPTNNQGPRTNPPNNQDPNTK